MIHRLLNKKDGKTYQVIGQNIVGNKKSDKVMIKTNKGIESVKITDVEWVVMDVNDIYEIVNASKPIKSSRKSPIQDKTEEFKQKLATVKQEIEEK